MLLDKCDGPPCPRCGCQDVKILVEPRPAAAPAAFSGVEPSRQAPTQWWPTGRAQCNHCRTRFSFREVAPTIDAEPELPEESEPQPSAQPAAPTKCPQCAGSRFYVYRTKGAIQYRKCKDCKHLGENKTIKGP
jgi:hypothetical protein